MRIGICTGGGDVPGLNPCIKAVVTRVADDGHEVFGIRSGWGGLLETDPAAEGNAVYKLPGFYADPLFKIYPEYSLKRRKIERPS